MASTSIEKMVEDGPSTLSDSPPTSKKQRAKKSKAKAKNKARAVDVAKAYFMKLPASVILEVGLHALPSTNETENYLAWKMLASSRPAEPITLHEGTATTFALA